MSDLDGATEPIRLAANHLRDIADEMALSLTCDDPHHPWVPQVFRDWVDFVDRVARPMVMADGDEKVTQAAMALYRKQNPYGVCVSLVMASNRVEALTAERDARANESPEMVLAWRDDFHALHRAHLDMTAAERDALTARVAAVEAYRVHCAMLRVEPSTAGLSRALASQPTQAAWQQRQVAAGICPASGLTLVSCRASEICDCFGWDGEAT